MASEELTTIYSQHTIYLQRLAASLGGESVKYLTAIEDGVVDILNKYRKRKNITLKLQADIQKQIHELSQEQLKLYVVEVKQSNRELGVYEGEFAANTANKLFDFESDVNAPGARAIQQVAILTPIKLGTDSFASYNNVMSKYWRSWTAEIDGVVMAGFNAGGTIQEISANIMTQFQLEGSASKTVLSRARRSAKQLATTGTNHYANTARIAFVDENDEQIKGYRFLAVQDSRTSTQCRSADQRVFAKDDSKLSQFTPPLHPNCRSALTYEVDDKYQLGGDTKRASSFEVDGKRDPKRISSDNIYYENLEKLKAGDQDAVLGRTMGKAFRKLDDPQKFAKLTVDSMGNPLTIKDLKKRDNELSRILTDS